jgi:hypothetical protein
LALSRFIDKLPACADHGGVPLVDEILEMAPHKLLHLIQRQASCHILAPELGWAFDSVPALREPVETQRGKDEER